MHLCGPLFVAATRSCLIKWATEDIKPTQELGFSPRGPPSFISILEIGPSLTLTAAALFDNPMLFHFFVEQAPVDLQTVGRLRLVSTGFLDRAFNQPALQFSNRFVKGK